MTTTNSTPTCTIDNCHRPPHCRTMCYLHYRRWRLGTDIHAPIRQSTRPPVPTRTCELENCFRKHYALGVCQYHYRQEWLAQRRGR